MRTMRRNRPDREKTGGKKDESFYRRRGDYKVRL